MKRIYLLLALAAMLGIFASGCTTASTIDVKATRSYSDPIAESILKAIKSQSYEGFSKDFNEDMKKGLDEKAFQELVKLFDEKIGAYQSMQFTSAQSQSKYVIVIYKAVFSNEPKGVVVRVIVEDDDGVKKVAGLYFDSPNLRQK